MDGNIVRRPPSGAIRSWASGAPTPSAASSDAALEVFGEVPYTDARVELITDKAGCSRPAFYQYFSSRDDVFWALAVQLGREMVALAEQLEPVTPDEDGLAQLTGWIDDFMALTRPRRRCSRPSRPPAATTEPLPRLQRRQRSPGERAAAGLRVTPGAATNAHHHPGRGADPVQLLRRAHARASSREPLVVGAGPHVPPAARRARRRREREPRPAAAAAPGRDRGARAGDGHRPLRPRGERTRQRLLEAGA